MKKQKLLRKITAAITVLFFSTLLITSVFADTATDSYTDTTKINTGSSSNYQVTGGQAKLASLPASTGGTITTSGGYTIHTFTGSGTFTPGVAGNVEVLVVAGGGGGGNSPDRSGGGGGAGGLTYNSSVTVTAQAYTITVGGGGGATGNGGNSSALGITTTGGGTGSSNNPGATSGGSGGGCMHNGTGSYGNGTSGQGNRGGTTGYDSGNGGSGSFAACGGGGAGAVGNNASGTTAGSGGVGLAYSISGSSVYYAGGGGGGLQNLGQGGSAGSGGTGGGGNGGNNGGGGNGTSNTGAGGGGGGNGSGGGSGGSGIVIIRYPTISYNTSGTIQSVNLLSGVPSVSAIQSFVYNLSSKPSGTGATIQFSQDGSTWKNSAGTTGGTDTLTTGANNSLSLSALNWSGANFYYKVALTGTGADTPTLDDITLNYASNSPPAAPTVSSPANAATGQLFRPIMILSSTDAEGDYIRYKIQIATDNGFTTNLQTFDQTASQTGWSGQNASSGTGYTSGTTATYSLQSALTTGTTYYVRSYGKDPAGSNSWSSASSTSSFTVVDAPTASAATSVEATSFIANWTGSSTFTSFRLDISTASDFSSYVTGYQNKTINGTSDSITGLNLATGATYYYRLRGVESNGDTSASSATITVRLGICSPPTSGAFSMTSSCRFSGTYDGVQEGNWTIAAGKTLTLNAGQRIAWTPGNSITLNAGSTIAVSSGGQLINGYVVYPDADSDQYVGSTTATVSATTVPSGYVKRANVRTFLFADRNDNNSAAYESRPLLDSAGNYGGWSGSDATAATLSTDSSTTYLSSLGAMKAVMTSVNTGTGADGALSVTSGTSTINTTLSGSAVGTAAGTTMTVTSTTGFAAGNEVFIIQTTGTGAGNYEYKTISSVNSGTQVTFTTALTNSYNGSTAQMIKVPQYTDVSVSAGATLTASAWDGAKGGVLVFRATGTVTNGGTITMSGKGFAAGSNGAGSGGGGNRTCGCGRDTPTWYSGGPGCAVSGGSGVVASGQGYGGGGTASGGGGGGGYGAAGTTSSGIGGAAYGQSTLTSIYLGSGGGGGGGGAGGCGGTVWCDNCGVDDDTMSAWGGWGGSGGNGAAGGIGGGIIFVSAQTLQNNVISSNGAAGSAGSNGGGGGNAGGWDSNLPCRWWGAGGNAGNGGGGGGGGSGGSISIQTPTITIGTIQANGGTAGGGSSGAAGGGGSGCYGDAGSGSGGGSAGGAGGVGRIRIDNSAGNATGSSPAPYSAALPSPQNVTMNRTLPAPLDLSGLNHVSFWVNSAVTGSVLRLQMGEAAATEQTFDFSVSAANTWEEKIWDISAITATSRDAIRYLQFKYLSDTSGTFRIDSLTYYE